MRREKVGAPALASKGAGGAVRRPSPVQLARLGAELDKGPAVHGWTEDQRWTLERPAAQTPGQGGGAAQRARRQEAQPARHPRYPRDGRGPALPQPGGHAPPARGAANRARPRPGTDQDRPRRIAGRAGGGRQALRRPNLAAEPLVPGDRAKLLHLGLGNGALSRQPRPARHEHRADALRVVLLREALAPTNFFAANPAAVKRRKSHARGARSSGGVHRHRLCHLRRASR